MHAHSAIIPSPRCSVSIRPAAADDLPFIDALQKAHTHMVGFLHRKALDQKLAAGQVLVAEAAEKLGYIISHDEYCGRDDVGIIYPLNVMPLKQRHLIGASLVKAALERAAYGCRLFCCWCAQDIQANFFWESIGFVPLAFRTGTRAKQRTHIFWQKRVRENDSITPWWFPSQTKSGAFREDRLVFPIPVGMHWRDPMPVVLPPLPEQVPLAARPPVLGSEGDRTGKQAASGTAPERPRVTQARRVAIVRASSKVLQGVPAGKAAVVTAGGIRYLDRADYVPEPEPEPVKKPRIPRPPAPRHDPADIAKVRELRDRFLEHVNTDPTALLPQGKYEVARALPDLSAGGSASPQRVEARVVPAEARQLPAAA